MCIDESLRKWFRTHDSSVKRFNSPVHGIKAPHSRF